MLVTAVIVRSLFELPVNLPNAHPQDFKVPGVYENIGGDNCVVAGDIVDLN